MPNNDPRRIIEYYPKYSVNAGTAAVHASHMATSHQARVGVKMPGAGMYQYIQPDEGPSRSRETFFHARRTLTEPRSLQRDEMISRVMLRQHQGESLQQLAQVICRLIFANDIDKVIVTLQDGRVRRFTRAEVFMQMKVKKAKPTKKEPAQIYVWKRLWKPKD